MLSTPTKQKRLRLVWVSRLSVVIGLLCGSSGSLFAALYSEPLEQFQTGNYEECVKLVDQALDEGVFHQKWRLLKIRAQLRLGRYPEAAVTLDKGLRRHPSSIEFLLLADEVHRYNGRPEDAAAALESIERLVRQSPWRYRDRESRVTLGRFLLQRGADARQVLEVFYDPVRQENPDYVDVHVAGGELALRKNDFKLASESFAAALKIDPGDPDIHCLLAKSQASDDAEAAAKSLAAALERNPRHADSLLVTADNQIDSERYADARETLDAVLKVNPEHPGAWSYLAVLAHLDNDEQREQFCRRVALGWWSNNPEVDHLIGKKLSQKYRFAEGAGYQQRALEMDADYLPAKIQLCQDWLRLGRETDGWQLANSVFERDQYNVLAHNLLNLHDNLAKFRTLEDLDEDGGGLIVRMEDGEAEVYGDRVLDLLRRAKTTLCEKYDVELKEPVIVEIFPRQADFAIRTFGMPGGQGFLGVCFGRVITANSPASQGDSPANWESVLWHEFCHVVTLHKTKNKMPRWFSEGISVYEEVQADETWGQSMNPRYREMILGDDLTPVSKLSGAFLSPPSAAHLQFAYYESSLVIEYLVQRYGMEMLKRVLIDLSVGMPINDSLARYTGSLEQLDEEFARFARQRAEKLGNDVDWSEQDVPTDDAEALAQWVEKHPKHFVGQLRYAVQLVNQERWSDAVPVLKRLIELYPEYTEGTNPYVLLATSHRRLNQADEERDVLEQLVRRDSDAVDACLRLLELYSASDDWQGAGRVAERLMSINPLIASPHRHLADAATREGRHEVAARSYRALLALDARDLALVHHQLALSLRETGQLADARRHALKSLEEAPRYRAAHRTLLEIVAAEEREQAADGDAEMPGEPPKADEKPHAPGEPPSPDKPDADKPDADKPNADKPNADPDAAKDANDEGESPGAEQSPVPTGKTPAEETPPEETPAEEPPVNEETNNEETRT